jgi:hypothetical protein
VAVSIAEYLGIDVENGTHIFPAIGGKNSNVPCPFRQGDCDKVSKGNKPVCSVRDGSGTLWIVCQHRLCATAPKDSSLTDYQVNVLLAIGKTIWVDDARKEDIAVKREAPVRTAGRSDSRADYVMVPTPHLVARDKSGSIGPVVLEMQGGGETSNTGVLTRMVETWENEPNCHTNLATLVAQAPSVGTIEANAWRRQQEQFLYKGNVAVNSFGRLVFAVGSKLYDYLMNNLAATSMQDLRSANWTLALVGISEDRSKASGSFGTGESVHLKIDESRLLFTSYQKFVQALTNQGGSDPQLFTGDFTLLDGKPFTT